MRQDTSSSTPRGPDARWRSFLKHGAYASGNGLLTQAPPNTGAGWFTPHDRRLAGRPRLDQQHVPHQRRAVRQQHRGVRARASCRPRRSPRRPSAAAKVAQIEWAGGAQRHDPRPDARLPAFLSGRGVATNYIGSRRRALRQRPVHRRLRPAVRHAAGYAGRAPFPAAAPTAATGWTGGRRRTARRRRCACGSSTAATDKYGLNAYIYDSTNDRKTSYDRVLSAARRAAADKVADLGEGEWADVKVKIHGRRPRRQDRRLAGQGRAARPPTSRTSACSTRPSAARSRPGRRWPGEPGFTGDFEDYVAQKFPSSTAADFAILEAGIASEDTYIEQGQYWATGYQPMIKYVMNKYQPDLLLVGFPTPTSSSTSSSAWSPRSCRTARNPAYDDVDLNGMPTAASSSARRYIRDAYEEADETMRLARDARATAT